MVLVIISVQFGETRKRESELMLKERRQFASTSTFKSESSSNHVGQWEALLQLVANLLCQLYQKCIAHCCCCCCYGHCCQHQKPETRNKSRAKKSKPLSARNTTSLKLFCFCCFKRISRSRPFIVVFDFRDRLHKFVVGNIFSQIILLAILVNSFLMAVEHHQQVKYKQLRFG